MSKADDTHFDSYREQTRTKHKILSSYLPAYFHAIKKWHQNLVFIDGFAGRGYYVDEDSGARVPGSPIQTLGMINENDDLRKRVATFS